MARQKGRREYCSWSLIYASDIRRRKFPRSTFATLAISALREIICPRKTYLPVFFIKEHIFARGNSPSEIAKAINTDAATINKNFMHFTNFEQKIQYCYHNQFFVTKDMWKKNFQRNCLQRNNLSKFVTTLSSAKTKHLPGFLNCRHFDAVYFYGAHSFSRGNHASDLKHAQSFCRCVIFDWFVLSMRMQVILDSSFVRPGLAPIWGGKKGEFRDWTK